MGYNLFMGIRLAIVHDKVVLISIIHAKFQKLVLDYSLNKVV